MRQEIQAPVLSVGGLLLCFGPFMAWGSYAAGSSTSGMDLGDGWMALVGGIAVLGFGLAAWFSPLDIPKWLAWAGLVVGLGVALINFFDILGTDGVSIGTGMWLMLVGGALALFGLLQKSG